MVPVPNVHPVLSDAYVVERVETPVITVRENAANREVGVTLEIGAVEGVTFYYTVDGTEPYVLPKLIYNHTTGAVLTAPDQDTEEQVVIKVFGRTEAGIRSALATATVTYAAKTYTVTFDSQEGRSVDPITEIAKDATVLLPTAPTRHGFAFDGWYTGIDGEGTEFTASTQVIADITVYAKWIVEKQTAFHLLLEATNNNRISFVLFEISAEEQPEVIPDLKSSDFILVKDFGMANASNIESISFNSEEYAILPPESQTFDESVNYRLTFERHGYRTGHIDVKIADVVKIVADKALIEAGTYEIPLANQTNQYAKTAWVQGAVDALIENGSTAAVSWNTETSLYDVDLALNNTNDTATIIVTAVDKSALTTALGLANTKHDNAVEGIEVGSYATGSKASFKAAIDLSQGVADDAGATQAQINQAVIDLATAEGTFNAAKWTLAVDSDFSGTTNGRFKYIGSDRYVEVPHTIRGVPVKSYYEMFKGTFVEGVKSTNTNVTNISWMFYNSKATTLDLSSLNTSSVTDMRGMFRGSQATSLKLSSFDTSSVTKMSSMFLESQATSLDLSSFDTSSVTDMGYMFYESQATSLDLSKFDTSSVTSMSSMFSGSQATSLDLSSFDTSSVTNMASMFPLSQATSLDLSSFDTSSVTDMGHMFYESQATSLDLSSFDTSKVTNMVNMFYESQATSLDLSSFDTSSVTNMDYMFLNSKATTGYARTQADADKLNASIYKPAALNFIATISSDTSLSDLSVNGISVVGFNKDTITYNIELAAGTTTVPIVDVTATDNKANVVLTDAASLPGSTTILVTAEDGTTTKTYTINFTVVDRLQ